MNYMTHNLVSKCAIFNANIHVFENCIEYKTFAHVYFD